MNEVSQVMLPILTEFLFITGLMLMLLSLAVGVVMLLRPSAFIDLNRRASTIFSLRKSTRMLEAPRYVDYAFYNHHKTLGIIVTLTSLYVLYYFASVFDASVITEGMVDDGYDDVYGALMEAIRITMLLTGAVALVVGVIVFIRPSKLKVFESWCNYWVSTRRASRALTKSSDQIDQMAYRNPKLVGIIIICLSIYSAISLFLIYIK